MVAGVVVLPFVLPGYKRSWVVREKRRQNGTNKQQWERRRRQSHLCLRSNNRSTLILTFNSHTLALIDEEILIFNAIPSPFSVCRLDLDTAFTLHLLNSSTVSSLRLLISSDRNSRRELGQLSQSVDRTSPLSRLRCVNRSPFLFSDVISESLSSFIVCKF